MCLRQREIQSAEPFLSIHSGSCLDHRAVVRLGWLSLNPIMRHDCHSGTGRRIERLAHVRQRADLAGLQVLRELLLQVIHVRADGPERKPVDLSALPSRVTNPRQEWTGTVRQDRQPHIRREQRDVVQKERGGAVIVRRLPHNPRHPVPGTSKRRKRDGAVTPDGLERSAGTREEGSAATLRALDAPPANREHRTHDTRSNFPAVDPESDAVEGVQQWSEQTPT